MQYSPQDILALADSDIIDTRSVEEYAKMHIPGALHLPLTTNFVTYAKLVLDSSKPIILILSDDSQFEQIAVVLNKLGYNPVLGYLKGGMAAWNYPIETLPTVSVHELEDRLKAPDSAIIDVRTENEFADNHILNAIHCPLGQRKLDHIPTENKLYLICGGGTRSSIMASVLKRKGYANVYNIKGGMSAWRSR